MQNAEREHIEAFRTNHLQLVELVVRVRNNDPTLTTLDLTDVEDEPVSDEELYLSNPACELLGRYIAANTHLESVDLPPNVRGISLLFKNLTGSPSLKMLNLRCQQFGLDVIRSMIIPFINNSPILSEIDLGDNENIDSECFKTIVEAFNGRSVDYLCFATCGINYITVYWKMSPSIENRSTCLTTILNEFILWISLQVFRYSTVLFA